jgi:ribosomal protein L11 methyltransferase
MAFGTGQHATTRGCLEAIEDRIAADLPGTALDVGTGSGILALALARLGVPRVVACDCDPAVLPIARANLARNRAAGVALVAGTGAAFRVAFDLVVANLLAEALVVDAATLAARVAPAGHLIVAGLLRGQVIAIRAAYPGWRLVDERGDDEWRTLVLRRDG